MEPTIMGYVADGLLGLFVLGVCVYWLVRIADLMLWWWHRG